MSYLSYTSLPGPEKKHVQWQTKYTQLQNATPRPTPSIGPLIRKVCISLAFLIGIATLAGIGVVAGLMDKSGQKEFVLHGIKCATCEEIAQHNPLLLVSGTDGRPVGCAGFKSGVVSRIILPTTEDRGYGEGNHMKANHGIRERRLSIS